MNELLFLHSKAPITHSNSNSKQFDIDYTSARSEFPVIVQLRLLSLTVFLCDWYSDMQASVFRLLFGLAWHSVMFLLLRYIAHTKFTRFYICFGCLNDREPEF